jgi:DNA excision repair protein ERCC-3
LDDERAAALHATASKPGTLLTADDDVVDEASGFLVHDIQKGEDEIIIPGTATETDRKQGKEGKVADQRAAMGLVDMDDDTKSVEEFSMQQKMYSFEIRGDTVEEVRRACDKDLHFPMLEEYDFRKDTASANLPIKARPSTQIRPYQEKSLAKMFGNGRARSGIIVLPCGAGKTLVGITAALTVKKSTLVLCTTGVAVDQWKRQFKLWTNLEDQFICKFTSSTKDKFSTDSLVVITTYSMMAFQGRRGVKSEHCLNFIKSHEWGLILLDEVHVAPAKMFRKCMSMTHSRCKLGLTATLVREDNLVDDLYFLIGPKLYEANWLDLQRDGHIATVKCIEIWCEMTAEFYATYLEPGLNHRKRKALYTMNPNKFKATQMLINFHEARGDKVLVFSDSIMALKMYARKLGKPYIFGQTSDQERLEWLERFQKDPTVNTLFLSSIGDNSIDLPDVNVIIQISSHFASRRQEAQRLGRILRPKAKSGRYNAYFYTLVSRDTTEMVYATKRQRFLVDQGYAFQVVKEMPSTPEQDAKLLLNSKQEQHDLLCEVMAAEDDEKSEKDTGDRTDITELPDGKSKKKQKTAPAAKAAVTNSSNSASAVRRRGNMTELSGADEATYAEYNREPAVPDGSAADIKPAKKGPKSSLFKARNDEIRKAKKASNKM